MELPFASHPRWFALIFVLIGGIVLAFGAWLTWNGTSWPARIIAGSIAVILWWMTARSLKTGEVVIVILGRPIIDRRQDNPFGYWVTTVAYGVVSVLCAVEALSPGLIMRSVR